MRRLLTLTAIVLIGLITLAAQVRKPAGTEHTGKAFRFNKVREGVYHAVGTGNLAVVGNSSFIVNDDDTKHSAHLPINGPGVPLIGVQRIYALLDQPGQK